MYIKSSETFNLPNGQNIDSVFSHSINSMDQMITGTRDHESVDYPFVDIHSILNSYGYFLMRVIRTSKYSNDNMMEQMHYFSPYHRVVIVLNFEMYENFPSNSNMHLKSIEMHYNMIRLRKNDRPQINLDPKQNFSSSLICGMEVFHQSKFEDFLDLKPELRQIEKFNGLLLSPWIASDYKKNLDCFINDSDSYNTANSANFHQMFYETFAHAVFIDDLNDNETLMIV